MDIDAPPARTVRHVPPAAREFRARLRDCFDPDGTPWPAVVGRTHDLGQQLLPRLRRVSYTQALVDGAFRLFVEYRPCDKVPHYRLTWGHLLWGRVDIRLGNMAYGADFHTSPALPFVQARLADYLIALGYRLDRVQLRPHAGEPEGDTPGDALCARDQKTDTREERLFEINIERERRRVAAGQSV